MMLQSSIFLSVAAIFGGVLLVTGLCGAVLARSRGRAARFRSAIVGVVGLMATLFAIRAIAASDVVPESAMMALLEKMHEVPDLVEDESVWGWTDRRTPIRMFRADAPRPAEDLREVEFEILAAQRRQGRVLRRQEPDDRSNCFGWVFAEGRYWLDNDQVETILHENGYALASTATPGDLAVYRNAEGLIHHAAVVRAVCDDGTILVEGKWGWMGVYLHRLTDSLYGQNVSLYRSERRGHALRVAPAGTVQPTIPADATP
jgi:hypothetical protein